MIIFGSPSRYVQGAGALKELGLELVRLGGDAVLVADPVLWEQYGDMIEQSFRNQQITVPVLMFGGDCTEAEIIRLHDALAGVPSVVVAAGGGKCIDAGKALAHRLNAKVVTVPSIASTDAPTSHNYVMYDDAHRMVGVSKLPRNPELVLADTAVIAKAPKQFFLAGIGDAIGKIHEVRCCANAQGKNIFGGSSAWTAVVLAEACHAILLEHAEAALAALDRKTPTPALERVVEATILMSGLAFESGGLSVAHSMTRGLTAVSPFAEKMHGLQVAYANVVQMHAQGAQTPEIDAFVAFSRRVGLPATLIELGGRAAADDEIGEIVSRTMTAPHIGHLPRPLDADGLEASIRWVESRYTAA
ncbi:glycerol dehydrogenase [Ochrobactrum teleogrylli]|nr:glycerol dehydrogenase [[Ochrobactrum] teleogrylli]